MNPVNKISKIIVQIDSAYEKTHKLHDKKKKRLFKRAIMMEKRLIEAVGTMHPLNKLADIKDMVRHQLTWMQERMTNRTGRTVRNPVSRTERRIKKRECNVSLSGSFIWEKICL